jgi:hypothetical protein
MSGLGGFCIPDKTRRVGAEPAATSGLHDARPDWAFSRPSLRFRPYSNTTTAFNG